MVGPRAASQLADRTGRVMIIDESLSIVFVQRLGRLSERTERWIELYVLTAREIALAKEATG